MNFACCSNASSFCSNNLIMQIEVEEKLHVKRITPTIIAIDTPVRCVSRLIYKRVLYKFVSQNHITSMFASEDSPLIYFLSEKRELTSLNTNTFEHESISLRFSFQHIFFLRIFKFPQFKNCGLCYVSVAWTVMTRMYPSGILSACGTIN